MRILQFINSMHTAGAEVLVYETSKGFIQHGHEVDVLLLNSHKSDLFLDLSEIKGINVIGLKAGNNIYNPINVLRIFPLIKKQRYDIIHVHLFPSFYWAVFAKKAFGKAKMVYTEHNTHNRRMGNKLYRWIDNLIYPFYDCHIAISDTVREKMEEHINLSKNKIVTIFNGINLSRIEEAKPLTKQELKLPNDSKVILQVSAFRPQKNQEILIRAVNTLDSNIHLLLAGEGETKEKNIALAKELGIEKRVHFLGVRKDIPRLLKTADIVVLSSHYEGLSLSSVEGLASGKPFIASDVPGLTEVVKKAGILFPEGNYQHLASEIHLLLNDYKHYQNVVKACMQRAQKYNIEKMVENYLKLYDNLLSTTGLF